MEGLCSEQADPSVVQGGVGAGGDRTCDTWAALFIVPPSSVFHSSQKAEFASSSGTNLFFHSYLISWLGEQTVCLDSVRSVTSS